MLKRLGWGVALLAGAAWGADDASSLRSDLEVAEALYSVPEL